MGTMYVVRNNNTGAFVCLIPSDEFDFFWENAQYASRFRTYNEANKICQKVKQLCKDCRKELPSLSIDAI